jgi:hypothetical protein
MTTKISTDLIADDAVTNDKLAANAVGSDQIAAGAVTASKIASGAVPVVLGVRQTVHGGPTSSGLPSFWPASVYAPSVTSLDLSTSGVSASVPFVVSASQGFGSGSERIGQSTANLTWTGLTASTTNYLYVDVGSDGTLTTGQTTTAPVYSWTASSGTNTFNITTMTMYTTGSTKGWRVFVGEAVTGLTSVSSVVMYAYNGRYTSYASAVTPLPTTLQTLNHNIGVTPGRALVAIECITDDAPFVANEVRRDIAGANGSEYTYISPVCTKKTMTWRAGSSASYEYMVLHSTSSARFLPTKAKWKAWAEAERGW